MTAGCEGGGRGGLQAGTRGRGAHPLRVMEEGVPGESGEVGRGQSIQGPVGHGEGFVLVLRAGEPLEALEPGIDEMEFVCCMGQLRRLCLPTRQGWPCSRVRRLRLALLRQTGGGKQEAPEE